MLYFSILVRYSVFVVEMSNARSDLPSWYAVRILTSYTYVEHGSKNCTGGLLHLCLENKQVPCYSIPENRPRCLVYLLDMYLSKLPSYAFEKDVRPKANTPASDKEPWYDRIPVGKNTLGAFVKTMCQKGGIENRSNHSLRATGTTCLFNASVPEKIIQKTTGHQSLSALRDYERVSSEQHQLQAVSRVLMSGSTYEKELKSTS